MTAAFLFLLAGQMSAAGQDIKVLTLQIAEKRVIEEHLRDGLSVDVGGPDAGVDVRVGVAISAERVDIFMRRVDGIVRYRLRADKVLDPIRARAR